MQKWNTIHTTALILTIQLHVRLLFILYSDSTLSHSAIMNSAFNHLYLSF